MYVGAAKIWVKSIKICSDIYIIIIITGTTSDKKFPFADCGAWEIIHGGREFFRLKQENERQG